MNEPTRKFASVVKEFCDWAESDPKTEIEEAKVAIRLLANLYSNALALPKNGPGQDIDMKRISIKEWNKVYKRFGALPFNNYSGFLSPANLEEEGPVTGDLADDLADIYRDLKEGQELYKTGHITEALWQWNRSFNTHWGRHASSALQALHAYAADEKIKL